MNLAICRLPPNTPFPDWATAAPFYSITATGDELSIVCPAECVPDEVCAERNWACLQVAGPLNFALTGVLADLAAPLASAGISIFALSTYDTDYLLVKAGRLANAIVALTAAGHTVVQATINSRE